MSIPKLGVKNWIASEPSSSQRRLRDIFRHRLREPPKGAWRSRKAHTWIVRSI